MTDPEVRAKLPNLIVIGAAKCGTSALHSYLAAHPQIGMSKHKELMFFGSDWATTDGLPYYASHFERERDVRGESSPIYTMWPYVSDVPEQMAAWLEDPRFIYVVGEPVDRVVAHWAEQYAFRRELRSLEQALADLDDPSNPYVCTSRYGSQFERYLRYFDSDQILIIEQSELRDRRRDTLQRAFSFVGVDPEFESPEFHVERNIAQRKIKLNRFGLWLGRRGVDRPWLRRGVSHPRLSPLLGTRFERPELPPTLRSDLERTLRPDIEHFRELTGLPLGDWSI